MRCGKYANVVRSLRQQVQARRRAQREDSGSGNYPPQYSKMCTRKPSRIALIVDNSDNFMSSTFESEMADRTNALNQPDVTPRLLQQTALEWELYPYIEYMKYCAGFDHAGICVGDDRWRDVVYRHKARGCMRVLVTPISKASWYLG